MKLMVFQNDIWGWGVEDKALQNRTEFKKMVIKKNFRNNIISRDDQHFKCFDVDEDKKNRENCSYNHLVFHYDVFPKLSEDQKETSIFLSGLNNIQYKVLNEQQIDNHIDKILVDI